MIPADWRAALGDTAALAAVEARVAAARRVGLVYPSEEQVYRSLTLTPFAAVRVVWLGQDPYHGPGQACGLAFAVPPGVRPPPSLANVFRERAADLGLPPADHGWLGGWSAQGVLLLNTTLTVSAGQAGSHRGWGWEAITGAWLRALCARPRRAVFVLLGDAARAHAAGIRAAGHPVVEAPHPSPLSAWRGFFGSRIFSRTNAALEALGEAPIDWRLPPASVRTE